VLKGDVRTTEQKTQIEQLARRVAGAVQVVNELKVK
jgi:osmotically-inducible protein OsmY